MFVSVRQGISRIPAGIFPTGALRKCYGRSSTIFELLTLMADLSGVRGIFLEIYFSNRHSSWNFASASQVLANECNNV